MTLLHVCCAPCAFESAGEFSNPGADLFWYNPNIHPYTEYESRLGALKTFAADANLRLIIGGGYGLRDFVRGTYPDFGERCGYCYVVRLRKTAEYAARNGYAAFSTTLLISPYQKHELIAETARNAAREFGVEFDYRDLRPLFREGQRGARAAGLYMQKYCGCLFSEEERYDKSQQPQKI